MKQFFSSRLQRFIKKRFPRETRITLDHNHLFILPTKFGYGILVTIILLFILGTNYQNNPILIVSYLLLGWFITAMILCFFNLNKTNLSIVQLEDGSALQPMNFSLKVSANKPRYQWSFRSSLSKDIKPTASSNPPEAVKSRVAIVEPNMAFTLPYTPNVRGHNSLPEIRLESRFPFGIFCCWTFLRFSNKHWVYPHPIAEELVSIGRTTLSEHLLENEEVSEETETNKDDVTDFHELRDYKVGEPLNRVSWKHQAKNPHQPWLVKEFSQPEQPLQWLTLEHVSNGNLDHKLSVLTQACINLSEQDVEFGLILAHAQYGRTMIRPNLGAEHLTECLQAFAIYGLAKSE